MFFKLVLINGLIWCFLVSCSDKKQSDQSSNNAVKSTVGPSTKVIGKKLSDDEMKLGDGACKEDIYEGTDLGITAIPAYVNDEYKQVFCKYTKVIAPNGKAISIFAQNKISNAQMIRAKHILEFFLEPVKDSQYGADKSAIANRMADNGAKLLLMNGSDDGENAIEIDGQPLFQTELVVEGSDPYIANDYDNHRDASFEEILHLVHDYGIGTSQEKGANEAYSQEIDKAMNNAMTKNIWPAQPSDAETLDWIEELKKEGSLAQEYLASVVDSYYGYWEAWSGGGGMWGIYQAGSRTDIKDKDPAGFQLMNIFFNPQLTYNARIDPDFTGTFSLEFDPSKPYTYKSQYLINAELTGDNNSNLKGNQHDNRLAGNSGVNILNGSSGINTATFKGNFEEYTQGMDGDNIFFYDSESNRDGMTTLKNIQIISFRDGNYSYSKGKLEAQ